MVDSAYFQALCSLTRMLIYLQRLESNLNMCVVELETFNESDVLVVGQVVALGWALVSRAFQWEQYGVVRKGGGRLRSKGESQTLGLSPSPANPAFQHCNIL